MNETKTGGRVKISLPADVREQLNKVPRWERSRLIATLLRDYFKNSARPKDAD